MKFSHILSLGLASLAVASPVAKASTEKRTDIADLTGTVSEIVSGVESLLGKIVVDVEALASAIGVDSSAILSSSGISLLKREEEESLNEARTFTGVEEAAANLVTDILGELVTLSATTGVSLIGTILSVLSL